MKKSLRYYFNLRRLLNFNFQWEIERRRPVVDRWGDLMFMEVDLVCKKTGSKTKGVIQSDLDYLIKRESLPNIN